MNFIIDNIMYKIKNSIIFILFSGRITKNLKFFNIVVKVIDNKIKYKGDDLNCTFFSYTLIVYIENGLS